MRSIQSIIFIRLFVIIIIFFGVVSGVAYYLTNEAIRQFVVALITDSNGHFLTSAFCRSMFTSMCLIFVNSVFVKAVGGKNYSQLFFFASIASVLFYLYFALLGDKRATASTSYLLGLLS